MASNSDGFVGPYSEVSVATLRHPNGEVGFLGAVEPMQNRLRETARPSIPEVWRPYTRVASARDTATVDLKTAVSYECESELRRPVDAKPIHNVA
ncbi:hypothetical protein CERSUDRAFT_122039, partial [Gelatoporia subvermispora B]